MKLHLNITDPRRAARLACKRQARATRVRLTAIEAARRARFEADERRRTAGKPWLLQRRWEPEPRMSMAAMERMLEADERQSRRGVEYRLTNRDILWAGAPR